MPTASPTVGRQVILDHLERCLPCAELLSYARGTGDSDALAAWRELLAVHLEREKE